MSRASNNTSEKKRLDQTAVQIQQEYYETVGDADWNIFEEKDRKCLLQNVAIALCGAPTKEGNLLNCVQQVRNNYTLQGYETRDTEACMAVFKKILEQVKYSHNNRNIFVSILRIVCVIPHQLLLFEPTPGDHWIDLHKKSGDKVHIYAFHVFSIRKCIPRKRGVKGCRIFIDHIGRVYKNWDSYLEENVLPKCVMVVPKNGEYKGECSKYGDNTTPLVKLTVIGSPALGTAAKVLSVVDTASGVANVGALGSAIGAGVAVIAAPAYAPVLAATALGIGAVTGIYAIGRSVSQLVDRSKHEQILMTAVQYLNYTNLATGAIGVGNGLWEMSYKYAKYGESPTVTEVFQFTTSALFLGIGVMSNQTAADIVQDAQAQKINEIRDSLSSNNKRRIFDKVSAETRRNNGVINGNAEVIKALKTINNKDEFFAQLNRINKQVNKNQVRISLTSDGKLLINNNYKHSVSNVYELGKDGRNQLFAKYGPANVTTKNVPTRVYSSCSTNNSFLQACQQAGVNIEDVSKIMMMLSQLQAKDQYIILDILSEISARFHDVLLLMSAELIASLIPEEILLITNILGDYKIPIILFVLKCIKKLISSMISERDYENDNSIVLVLKCYIHDGQIDRNTLLVLKQRLLNIFMDFANLTDFRDISDEYDFILKYRETYCKTLTTIRAGEEIEAGPHKILIMSSTIEKLDELFQDFEQEKCDRIMELTFKIISILKAYEIEFLIELNPDEDIVIRVADFILKETGVSVPAGNYTEEDIENKIKQLLTWRRRQRTRRRSLCNVCDGFTYI